MKTKITCMTVLFGLWSASLMAQTLSGSYTIDNTLPASSSNFTSLRAAIDSLNAKGVGGSGVTFNITAGQVFTENPSAITASGTASAPVVFQKTPGINPLLRDTGNSGSTDFGICIDGGDYITFNGLDVTLNVGNTTEFGYLVKNNSATNGAKFNTIKNCSIYLNRSNTLSTAVVQTANTLQAPGNDPSDSNGVNSYNKYYNLKISNCYNGIKLMGSYTYPDMFNEIGGNSGDSLIVGANAADDIGTGSSPVASAPNVSGISVTHQNNIAIHHCIIRNLTVNHATNVGIAQGIVIDQFNNGTFGTSNIYSNFIYNIRRTGNSTSTLSGAYGIRSEINLGNTANMYNNVIYGLITGNPTATTNSVAGMQVRGITGTLPGSLKCYNNSIWIDNSAATNGSSAAIFITGTTAGNGLLTAKNNILVNTTAAQAGATGHYAIVVVTGTVVDCSHNLYWVTNSNGFVGRITAINRTTLYDWNVAISGFPPTDGLGQGSTFSDPVFASTSNLSFSGPTPVKNSGTAISSPAITTDIYGNARGANPTLGAIETTQPLDDKTPPILSNVQVTNGVAPVVRVDLKDNSNAAQPANIRLWYREGKSGAFTGLDADVKPVGTINGTYTWSTQLLPLAQGYYQFYIVARDTIAQGRNLAVNPIWSQGYTTTIFEPLDPPNLDSTSAANEPMRSFVKPISLAGGTYTVGTTGTFPNLDSVSFILNSANLLGNVTFELQSDYDGIANEKFPLFFNQVITTGGNWKVVIRPQTGTTNLTTSGDPGNSIPLIDLSGADNVTFDGRPGGVGTISQWTISNPRLIATNGGVFRFSGDATNDTIEYLTLSCRNAPLGTVWFGNGLTTGNNNNVVMNCNITSLFTTYAANAIYAQGSASAPNSANVIRNNNLYNWSANGVLLALTGTGDNWVIDNNHFYETNTMSTILTGITVQNGNGHQVTNNSIGGAAPDRSGAPLQTTFSTVSTTPYCFIGINVSTAGTCTISSNTIANVYANSGGTDPSFIGISTASTGNGSILNNTIGGVQNAYDTIRGNGEVYGIRQNSTGTFLVSGNTISNITNVSTGSDLLRGIQGGSGVTNINNNSIHDLTLTSASFHCTGIVQFCNASTVTNNKVYNIYNYSIASSAQALGINLNAANVIASKNRIYNIHSNGAVTGGNAPLVIGIQRGSGDGTVVSNNQISLIHSGNAAKVYGIWDAAFSESGKFYYNSVYLGGTTVGSTSSYAFSRLYPFYLPAAPLDTIRNNIFYNERTSTSDTARHFAVGVGNEVGMKNGAFEYNLLVTKDTSKVAEWTLDAAEMSFNKLNDTLATLPANWSDSAGNIPSGVFFKDITTGDLRINEADPLCWYVNGKGTSASVNGISDDYEGTAVRSTQVATGASDIGSDEFNTVTAPPLATVTGTIGTGSQQIFTFAGRRVASLVWANATGSFPSSIALRYYTGTIPPAVFAGARYLNAYHNFTITGGSGYDYTMAINYDPAMLGNVTAEANLRLAKRESNWSTYATSTVNTPTRSIVQQPVVSTASVVNFTGTDVANPLPVKLISLSANRLKGDEIAVSWATITEINSDHFEIERSYNGEKFEVAGEVKAAGNSKVMINYQFTDLGVQPASIVSGNVYYRLKLADKDGGFEYSGTVAVKWDDETGTAVAVYPNPFTADLSVKILSAVAGKAMITLTDITGHKVMTNSGDLHEGNNVIVMEQLGALKTGLYFLSVEMDGKKEVQKLVKE